MTIAVTDATVYKKLPNGFDSIQVRYRLKVNVRRVNGALVASKVERKRGHRRSDDNAASEDHHGGNDDHGGNGGHGGGNDD